MISVGATDDGGQVADFSSYGKVDVVAPGDCVAVAVVPGFDQDRGCPGDNLDGVAFNSGTSFSAPIVAGVLALANSRSPLLARLALESSADEDHPGGASDAKQWAHGLVDADAFVDAHDPAAPPALVLETTRPRVGRRPAAPPGHHLRRLRLSGRTRGGRRPGFGQLRHAVSGTADFEEVEGEEGTYQATLDSGELEPGLQLELATATVDGDLDHRLGARPGPGRRRPGTRHRPGRTCRRRRLAAGGQRGRRRPGRRLRCHPRPGRPPRRVDRQPLARPGGRPALRRRHHRRVRPARPDRWPAAAARRSAARPPASTSRPRPAAPTCSTCSPPGRPATTA